MSSKYIFLFLVVLTILISFISLAFGSQFISPFYIFLNGTPQFTILFHFRLPRILIAICAGGLLATAGFILQTLLKNNLASPDVIGLNKGSALAIVICTLFTLYPSKSTLIAVALLGSFFTSLILFFISRRFSFSGKTIILTGIALSFLFDAITKLLTFSQKQLLMKQLTWLIGSLWGRYWEMIPLLIITCFFFLLTLYFSRDQFFLLQLDHAILSTLGKKATTITWLYLLIAAIATGVAVSTVGAISFIGLIAPHIAKKFTYTYTSWRFAFVFLTGSIILLLADLFGRSILSPLEIPAGIIVSLVGGPYFLFILLKQSKTKGVLL
ncbi:MAG: FecCD family ABC transporter permease [Culicoidibacterales bacterium]